MSTLEQRLTLLRTRIRRLVTIRGLCAVLAALLATLILLGLTDYLLRFEDRGLRVICWLAVLGVLAWTTYRRLYRPLAARWRDVDLALRLQDRFPALGDRLVSAVEFLRQSENDPTAGSAALRRAVIAQATAETEPLDFTAALDRRPPLRAILVALAVGTVAALLVIFDPVDARIAMARLLDPFGAVAWPQTTHLALRQPVEHVARGRSFDVEVIDSAGARLPAEVRIHYRFEDAEGKKTEQTERMQLLSGAMVARRENVSRSFAFRVEGGDDHSMPWQAVEVLEPPAVESLAVALVPPAYTGWPTEKLTNGASLRGLVGTHAHISGVATKPLASATMRLEGGRDLPARIADDGLHFSLPEDLVIEKSGAYWFDLTDRDGLSGGSESRWEIRAVPDLPPSVTIERPATNIFVTPRAVVPLRVTVKDDLALRRVALVFAGNEPSAIAASIVLYEGPPQPEPQPGGMMKAGEADTRRTIDYLWELESLGLAPGTQLTFYAAGEDYHPQTGKSEPRQLNVITAEELQQRIAAKQNLLLAELVRLLKIERDSRAQVQSLEIRTHETGGLGQLEVDRLQAAELNQRQVGRGLTSRSDGVPMQILALLADLENNRIDNPDFQRHMQSLLDEIERLEREHLPPIGRELTAAIKTAQVRLQPVTKPSGPDTATEIALTRAGEHQDHVIAALEAMLSQLRQWDDYRRFHRDISQLLHDQEELARGAVETGRSTLTKDVKDLSPQEAADLKVLAGRQFELARRLDRIEQEMEQTAGELRPTDPLVAETLADAVDEARRLAVAAAMRMAGGQLQENRVGQVVAAHKEILQSLQEVLDILANRKKQELDRLVKKLGEAEQSLAALRQQQEGLRKKFEQADDAQRKAELDRLRREQEGLQKEAERMARRLERLLAEQASQTTRAAAGQMGKAGQAAGQERHADAAEQAKQAEKSLADAARQLNARKLQAQAELMVEQMARLGDALKYLHQQQGKVLDETRRLAASEKDGSLTRAQATGLRELARLQQALQADTAHLGQSLFGAAGFQLTLSTAQDEMGRAAALLDRRQTGEPVQQAQQNALTRLALALKALEPEKPDPKAGDKPPGAGGGGSGKPGGQPGSLQAVAELKMLKLLQEDVNLRTQQLQKNVAAGGAVTDAEREQFARLSAEQGRLSEIVFQLMKPKNKEGAEELPEEPKPKEERP